ncbi:MAG: hypothetical protein KKD35_01900 [Elusimicrobia bacterium]|nr:hypothetical protein [Elusimicrobiota bacterium]
MALHSKYGTFHGFFDFLANASNFFSFSLVFSKSGQFVGAIFDAFFKSSEARAYFSYCHISQRAKIIYLPASQ